MFISFAISTLILIFYLTFRDWIHAPRFSRYKALNTVAQLLILGDYEKAEKIVRPLIEKGKGGKQALLYQIQILQGLYAFSEALQLTLELSRAYPEELLFRLEEGKILLALGKPKEAVDAFQVASPILRNEGDILSYGEALQLSGYAIPCLELLEPLMPITQNGKLLAVIASAYCEQKRYSEAISCFNQAIKYGYCNHQLLTQLGNAYRRHGNLSASESIFRGILEKDSADIDATLGLGSCMEERGFYQKALLIYQSGKAWETKNPLLLKQAGICALRTKKYRHAQLYFEELLQHEDPKPQPLFLIGYSLEGQNKWQEAEQLYLKLIEQFPSDHYGYRALSWMFGVGLATTLSNEQGVNFAHISLKLQEDIVAWEILSACEARVGNFERAYQIQKSLTSHPLNEEDHARRQQAMRTLRKQLPLDNNHVIRKEVA